MCCDYHVGNFYFHKQKDCKKKCKDAVLLGKVEEDMEHKKIPDKKKINSSLSYQLS